MQNFKSVVLLSFVFLSLSFSSLAQEIKSVEWHTNFTKVSALAAEQDKPILLFFHGSDWCPPCILMQKEVFQNAEFISFVSGKILFQDVDFPFNIKLSSEQYTHNQKLKSKFGLPEEYTQGFPQVVIVDANGKVLYQEKGYAGEGTKKLMDKITSIIKQ